MRLAPVLLLVACAGPPRHVLKADEIRARDLELPRGAEAGMFMTWRSGETDSGVVEETTACVERTAERTTIEWRETHGDGRVVVTAARYSADQVLLGAWRGAAGETGRRLSVLRSDRDYDLTARERELDRRARQVGISVRDTEAREKSGDETVSTPAGDFDCRYRKVSVTMLPATTSASVWWSKRPLPLDRTVQVLWKGPMGMRSSLVLVAYGYEGAAPTLIIPD